MLSMMVKQCNQGREQLVLSLLEICYSSLAVHVHLFHIRQLCVGYSGGVCMCAKFSLD